MNNTFFILTEITTIWITIIFLLITIKPIIDFLKKDITWDELQDEINADFYRWFFSLIIIAGVIVTIIHRTYLYIYIA